jgi:hypothetical protein
VNSSNSAIFLDIARELWNVELFELICDVQGRDCESLIAELRLVHESGGNPCDFDVLVERCSSTISELPRSSLSEMSVALLRSILSHRSVKMPLEDWLYDFVKAQLTRDTSYSTLLELIRYEYLSLESIHDFTELISATFDFLTYPVWLSLIPRLTLSVAPPGLNDRCDPKFVPCAGGELKGIMSFLSGKCGGNFHDRGIVAVSASSQQWSDCPVQLVVDFNSSLRCFATKDEPNSWICIEFKNHRIKPTHYSIRSRTDGHTTHLRSWNLEGLTDEGKWVRLDCRTGNTDLGGAGAVRTFSIGSVYEVRSVRLQQTGVNSSNNNHLILKSIEFFGELRELSPSVQ